MNMSKQKVVTISTSSAASKVHACSSAKPLSSKLSSASLDVRHREENLQSVVRFKPVVFMGEALTCPPGFLGGSAPVVSFSRYKFKAVRHCLCGIVFKYRTLGQLLQSIFTNSSLLPQKLQTWIQSKLVKKNTQLQLLLNRFYACTLTLSSCHLDVNTLFNCSLKMILQRSQFFTLAWRGRDTSAGRLAKN